VPKGFRILDLKVSKRRYIKNTFFGQQFTTAYQLNSYVHLEEEKTIHTQPLITVCSAARRISSSHPGMATAHKAKQAWQSL
jgi:hypothetical protein